ncbi:MAG: hypothetical protein IPG07_19915 [Crocinitomicaceae bacterium]|nr:hypothetical protein [Crocinitomicaceae bacterium]
MSTNEYNENSEPKKAEPVVEETAEAIAQPEKKDKLFSGRTLVRIMNGEFLTRDSFLNNLPLPFSLDFYWW